MPSLMTWDEFNKCSPARRSALAPVFIVRARVEDDPNSPGDDRLVVEEVTPNGEVRQTLFYLDKRGFEFVRPTPPWVLGYSPYMTAEFRVNNGHSWAKLVLEPERLSISEAIDKMKEIKICL
jgi:hypothetical protein